VDTAMRSVSRMCWETRCAVWVTRAWLTNSYRVVVVSCASIRPSSFFVHRVGVGAGAVSSAGVIENQQVTVSASHPQVIRTLGGAPGEPVFECPSCEGFESFGSGWLPGALVRHGRVNAGTLAGPKRTAW
jgi:hypothetical protein